MKTNIEHLRDLIKDDEEAIEFLDAIKDELNDANEELDDANKKIDKLTDENKEQEKEIELLEASLESDADMERIDCGIGVILYRQPENLQLEIIMDEFKEKMESGKLSKAPLLFMENI
jgi:chromosome segregation ATPase